MRYFLLFLLLFFLIGCGQPNNYRPSTAANAEAGRPVVEAGRTIVEAGRPVVEAGNPVVEAENPAAEADSPTAKKNGDVTKKGSKAEFQQLLAELKRLMAERSDLHSKALKLIRNNSRADRGFSKIRPYLDLLEIEVHNIRKEWLEKKVSESKLNLKAEKVNLLIGERNRLLKDFIQFFNTSPPLKRRTPRDDGEVRKT